MSNGRLDTGLLASISGVLLTPATARAFTNMAEACRAATGAQLDIVNYWGGYRDLAMQRALAANPPPGISIAAVGASTHGYGTALDITYPSLDAAKGWVQRHCREYGFTPPPAGDRNHFVFTGVVAPAATPSPATIPAVLSKETTMFLIGNGKAVALVTDYEFQVLNLSQYDNVYKQLDPPLPEFIGSKEVYEQARLDTAARAAAHTARIKTAIGPAPTTPAPAIDTNALAQKISDNLAARLAN